MTKILVAVHDAGGANILASLITKYRHMFKWKSYAAGPARNIFLEKKIKSSAIPHLSNADIDGIFKAYQPDFLLTGTSWGSDVEVGFIKQAKKNKIKSASFLDQWGGYRERFGYPADWKAQLPDVLFVGDEWAYQIALKNGFPKKRVWQVENPYFAEILVKGKKNFKKVKNSSERKIKLLYVSQPIYAHALTAHKNPYYWGFTEYDIVEDLLRIVEVLRDRVKIELRIRLHPSEKSDKYSSLLKKKHYKKMKKLISVSSPFAHSLVKDCGWADGVVGSGSMALFVALLADKKSISYVPYKEQETLLSKKEIAKLYVMPQKEIKMVFSVESLIEELSRLKNGRVFPSEEIQRALAKNSFLTVINAIV